MYILTLRSNNSDHLDPINGSLDSDDASGSIEFDNQNSLISNIDIYQATEKMVSLVGR